MLPKRKRATKTDKKIGIAASVAVITGLIGFYFARNYDLSSFYHLETTSSIQDKSTEAVIAKQQVQPEVLVSQIPSWEDSSTRQLVYAALPKNKFWMTSMMRCLVILLQLLIRLL